VFSFLGRAPARWQMSQNYPNPFNPATVIRYALPARSHVTLRVYDVLGQEVKRLVDAIQEAGYREVVWSGMTNSGNSVTSGVYFYKIQAISTLHPGKRYAEVKKMLLLR